MYECVFMKIKKREHVFSEWNHLHIDAALLIEVYAYNLCSTELIDDTSHRALYVYTYKGLFIC